MVREIKAPVMSNVSITNQIPYENKLTQKTLKLH